MDCSSLPPFPRSFLVGGFLWVLFSLGISIMRLFSLQLLADDVNLDFVTDDDTSRYT